MERLFQILYRATVVLLFLVLFFYGISQARLLLYPVVLGVLFAYLLYPVASWLETKGARRIVANLAAILVGIVVIGGVAYVIYSQLSLLMEDLPTLKEQAKQNLDEIGRSLAYVVQMREDKFDAWVDQQVKSMFENTSLLTEFVFPSTTSTVMAAGLLPVYVFLFLFYRNKIFDFVLMIFPKEKHDVAVRAMREISHVTKRYMGGVFLVVLILSVVNSAGLLIIGLRFAVLFGVISAICNFIPYFGTLIGAAFPLLMAVFTGDSPHQALSVAVFFLFVQFTENNILTPNITGGSVQVNPLVTIISLIAGGMIWGVPGMFVVVPLMGMLKILLEHNETTQPLAFLIGTRGTEAHSITGRRIKNFFGKFFARGSNG